MAIQDDFRKKFHDLTDTVNAIRAKSKPLRDERDAKIDDLTKKQLDGFNEKIRAIEAPLYDLENERAMIVRALNGKTGIRQEDGSVVMPEKEEAAAPEVAETPEQ